MNKKIFIEGMTCSHCVARVQKALEALDGVSEVRVDLEEKYAQFKTLKELDNKQIIDAVDEAGYDVIKIQ